MGRVIMGACHHPCQLGSLSSRSGCAWTRLLVCSVAAPAPSPQGEDMHNRKRSPHARNRDASGQVEPSLYSSATPTTLALQSHHRSSTALPFITHTLVHIVSSWWPRLWSMAHRMLIWYLFSQHRQQLGAWLVLLSLLREAKI